MVAFLIRIEHALTQRCHKGRFHQPAIQRYIRDLIPEVSHHLHTTADMLSTFMEEGLLIYKC